MPSQLFHLSHTSSQTRHPQIFFWQQDLHVNKPDSGSPVYTIVFPLKPIFPTQKNFGALGLIYPDYEKYEMERVKISCSGENSNLTDPMFGYTQ